MFGTGFMQLGMKRETSVPPQALVVDDCEDIREIGRALVVNLGFEPVLAENGEAALERFEESRFAFVLMDCRMPICDGFEAARRMRDIEKGRGVGPTPIIAVSAERDFAKLPALHAAGINAFLAKPVSTQALRQKLDQLIPSYLARA